MPYTNSKGAFPNQPIIRGERPDTTDKNFTITDNLIDDIVIFHFQKQILAEEIQVFKVCQQLLIFFIKVQLKRKIYITIFTVSSNCINKL